MPIEKSFLDKKVYEEKNDKKQMQQNENELICPYCTQSFNLKITF